jgi:nucleoside-diphosphate-sugar epimerase
VHHTAADITDREALISAMDGVNAVVHLAALLHATRPPLPSEAEYRRINVEGAVAVFAAAQSQGVKRVVFTSTIAVYGSARSGAVDEETAAAPDTPYSRSKYEAETELRRCAERSRSPDAVVLRLAAVYGPGIKGNYDRLVRTIARRRFVPVGTGTNRRTLVYEDDAARAVVVAASHPAAGGRTFNVVGGVHTVAEITGAIAAALGRRPPLFSVPLPAARLAVSAIESLGAAAGYRSPVTRAALDKYTEDLAVRGERIRHDLGFAPQVALLEGWRRTIASMREQGRLP